MQNKEYAVTGNRKSNIRKEKKITGTKWQKKRGQKGSRKG